MGLVKNSLLYLKCQKHQKPYPFFLTEISKYGKYKKKILLKFDRDSLDCGPVLDNLKVNPKVQNTYCP